MIRTILLCFLSISVCLVKVEAQQSIIIPNQYEDKIYNAENAQQIVFFAYPYVSSEIDLFELKKRFPKTELPENIKIVPPALGGFQDVTVLMTVMQANDQSDLLILWLVGNYKSNRAYFMIDENMDGDFTNDGKPMGVKAGQKSQRVELKPKGKNGLPYELFVELPRRPDFIKLKSKQLKGVRSKIVNKMAASTSLGFGVGQLNYEYDNLTTGYPTWYSVNFSEKSIGLAVGYNHSYFRLDANFGYQNIFYYTSYLNIRTGEPERRLNPNTGRYITEENVDTRRNLDTHAKHRFLLGLTAAIRIHIGTYSEIQPYFGVGRFYFSPDEYSLRESSVTSVYEHQHAPYVEAGIRAEFATGIYRSFFIETGIGKLEWNPTDFFESVPHENLNTNFWSWKMAIGYRIGF